MEQRNSSFSTTSPNLQIAWDSTSLGTLKECPRKYYYTMVLGYVPRAENVHLSFGQKYHAALETYDHERSAGKDHVAAMRAAVRRVLIDTRVELPGGGWKPWDLGDPNKNRHTLLRTVIWYLEEFGEDDSIKTIQLHNGKPAVELSFRFETDFHSLGGESFLICGHLDRVGEFGGQTYIIDRKTTKNTISEDFFKKFRPDNQMSVYDLAGTVAFGIRTAGIIIDGAQIAVTFSRFLRGFTDRSDEDRAETYADFGYWVGQAEIHARNNYWPKNDKSCDNYGGCPFRPVCSKSESSRDLWLRGKYVKRTWDPLVIRGDI